VPPLTVSANPEQQFEELSARFRDDPSITSGTGFGSSPGLRVGGKIFAMLVRRELVLKLPKARVDELVSAGKAVRFDPGHGRVMNEWVTVRDPNADWPSLAADALAFVDRRT
jgi:hypothetical protein